jgi:hypothetical protein
MKTYQKFFAAFLAVCFMTVAAFAADATPAGTWKFTQAGRGGGPGMERTFTLDYKEGKLTGTMKGTTGGPFEIPDSPITDGSFKDGKVAFTVTFEINDFKISQKYEGKLEGDKITGNIERPGRDGGAPTKNEWVATRVPAK